MQPKFRAVFCRGWDYSTWCENGAGRRQALRAKHCEDAVTRWQNFTGQTATLEATGEAFESKGVSA